MSFATSRWLPILRRVGSGLLTLCLVAVVVFFAVEALPGDACTAYLGRLAQGPRLETCRTQLGLERPSYERFADWVAGAAVGDFGVSQKRAESVSGILVPRLRNTALLALLTALIAVPLAVGLGVIAGLARERFLDHLLSWLSLLAMTVPDFVSATLLVLVFSIWLGWFPGIVTAPADAPILELLSGTVLPIVALVLVATGHILRLIRSGMIEVMASDYVEVATLRGLPYWRIVLRHAFPGAIVPAIHLIGLTLGWLLSGVVVVEVVFNYPGLGRLMVDAVSDRDLPLVQAIALVLAAVHISMSLFADLLTVVANPKLRSEVAL
jgi:peptide/nickel transport system permease protein